MDNTCTRPNPPARDVPVTRIEILDAVEHAFENPPLSKDDLLEAAIKHDARPAVLDLLDTLPPGTYRARVDLWPHLEHVPVDHP